jgi:ribosomal protein S18 acetylase RimI-like enzyme
MSFSIIRLLTTMVVYLYRFWLFVKRQGVLNSALMEIRRALPRDGSDIAVLILHSAEHFLPALFGPSIGQALARLSAERANLFSYEHTRIADEGGKTLAMLLGYTGAVKANEDPRTGLLLLRFLGAGIFPRLPALLRAQRAVAYVVKDAYYVSNVAVRPDRRGRGIGAALFEAAEAEARGLGCASICLDVETENTGAVRLYERLGFSKQGPVRKVFLKGAEPPGRGGSPLGRSHPAGEAGFKARRACPQRAVFQEFSFFRMVKSLK